MDKTSHTLLRHSALLACALLALLASCGGSGSGKKNPGKGDGDLAAPKQPGIRFTKTSVGLPTTALDYVGAKDATVAGAKNAKQVFFAVPAQDKSYDIYVRDLTHGVRAKVASVERLVPGSLTVDLEGRYLVYCRMREITKYIDDPGVDVPSDLSLVYRYDVNKKEEQAVYDFRSAEWLPYRNGSLMPLCSNDGSLVAAMAYNNDLSILGYTSDRWLQDYARITKGDPSLSDTDLVALKKNMTDVLTSKVFAARFKELGINPPAKGDPGIDDKSAVQQLRDSLPPPQWAILLWKDGKSSILPIKLDKALQSSMLTLAAVGSKTLIIGTSVATDPDRPQSQYFSCNPDSGAVQPFALINGIPTHIALDDKEEKLVVLYNPTRSEGKGLENYTSIKILPLNGDPETEQKYDANYLAIEDLTPDTTQMLAQDQFDRDLYLVNTESGDRQRLIDFVSGSQLGVFLPAGARQGVFLENGILFSFTIPADPQASKDWRSADFFKDYDSQGRAFLDKLGFKPGQGMESSWEGREGIGLNEYAGVYFDAAKPDTLALMRYDVKGKRFTSLFFTSGYNMAADKQFSPGAVDAYSAQAEAEAALKRAGWLSDKAEYYQIGASPLYDQRSDTFIFVFRDSYALASGQSVVNAEATIRVRKSTGELVEMSVQSYDPIQDFKITATDDQIQTAVRNFAETPLPPQAKARIDVEHKRLVIAEPKDTQYGPAPYSMPGAPRLYYEVDVYSMPENELVWTSRVDAEKAVVLDQLYYLPTSQNKVVGQH